jgi:hypothetical protein
MLFTFFFLAFVLNFLMLDFSLLTDQLNLDNIINTFYDQYNRIRT